MEFKIENAKHLVTSTRDTFDPIFRVEEALYSDANGEYFLHCKGGAGTRYAKRVSVNRRANGEKMIHLTEEAAKSWAKKNLNALFYHCLFGWDE